MKGIFFFFFNQTYLHCEDVAIEKGMKDQIPYVTQVHELRDEFRLVFTQAIPTNGSGWLAQRSGLGYGIWENTVAFPTEISSLLVFFLFHFYIFSWYLVLFYLG